MNIVMLANAWSAGVSNPTSKHHLARQFAAQGHRVLWVEGAGMRSPSLGSGTDRLRIVRKLMSCLRGARKVADADGDIHVLTPLLLPLPRYAWVRRVNGLLYLMAMRFWACMLGMRDAILVNYVPVLAHCMEWWPGLRVYHCVDRWDAFAMYDSEMMGAMDERCCRAANLVVASASDLETRCRRHSEHVNLVMHGVEHEHFSSALDALVRPNDVPKGKIVGFFGLLSEWVDQALLLEMARALPDATVLLIGAADVDVSRLEGESNICVLGPKPFAELPAYSACFNVGIIPFEVSELTRAVNPVKLREMMSAGCPVVSTALPEVCRVVGETEQRAPVHVADDAASFIESVKAWVYDPASADERARISASVSGETWRAKSVEILSAIETRREELVG